MRTVRNKCFNSKYEYKNALLIFYLKIKRFDHGIISTFLNIPGFSCFWMFTRIYHVVICSKAVSCLISKEPFSMFSKSEIFINVYRVSLEDTENITYSGDEICRSKKEKIKTLKPDFFRFCFKILEAHRWFFEHI